MYALAASARPGMIALGVLLVFAGPVLYFLPAIIALVRKVPNRGSVIVVDLLLAWTVIGWIAALAMACRSKPPHYGYPGPGYYPRGYYPQQPRP